MYIPISINIHTVISTITIQVATYVYPNELGILFIKTRDG